MRSKKTPFISVKYKMDYIYSFISSKMMVGSSLSTLSKCLSSPSNNIRYMSLSYQVSSQTPGPIYDPPADHDSLVLISDPSFPSHVTRQLVPGAQTFTLVDREVSCTFRINMKENQPANGVSVSRLCMYLHYSKGFLTQIFVLKNRGVQICFLVEACKARSWTYLIYSSYTMTRLSQNTTLLLIHAFAWWRNVESHPSISGH